MKRKKTIKKRTQKEARGQIKANFKKFKKIIEKKLGKINWGQVGIYAVALLLYVAVQGFLGPKAQIVAFGIIKLSTYA